MPDKKQEICSTADKTRDEKLLCQAQVQISEAGHAVCPSGTASGHPVLACPHQHQGCSPGTQTGQPSFTCRHGTVTVVSTGKACPKPGLFEMMRTLQRLFWSFLKSKRNFYFQQNCQQEMVHRSTMSESLITYSTKIYTKTIKTHSPAPHTYLPTKSHTIQKERQKQINTCAQVIFE